MRTTSGHLIIRGQYMKLKEQQPSMNIDEQLENLKAIGLKIDDEDYARQILNDISYFRLIKAYGLGLKRKNTNFDGSVSFEQIVELYLFNANFRQLLFSMIERIEINLRCRLANHFSHTYGVLGYEEPVNFNDTNYHKEFLEDIENEILRNSKAPFVKNFKNNYADGKIPFYALVELFSFGTLSKFYKNMKPQDKKTVAQIYGVGYTYLESWIEHIAFVRNICAHYGRLYNVNLAKTPKLYKQYFEKGISSVRVYATLLCLKHLVPNDRHWIEFVDKIKLLFEKYSHVNKKLMGFPDDWENVLKS